MISSISKMVRLSFYLLFYFVDVANSQLGLIRSGNHVICDPTAHSMHDFTGLRVQHQIILGPVPQHHTRISLCLSGAAQLSDHYYYPMTICSETNTVPSSALAWATTICSNDIERRPCLKIARLMEFTQGGLSLDNVSTGTWVGGIYKCPLKEQEECTDANAIPLFPLVKESRLLSFTQIPNGRNVVQRIPVVSTVIEPSDAKIPSNWSSYISATENYPTIMARSTTKLCSPVLYTGDGRYRRPIVD